MNWLKPPANDHRVTCRQSPNRLKRGDRIIEGCEPHPGVAPGGGAGRRAGLVEPARRLLDEATATPAGEQPADRRVVADVGGDAESTTSSGASSSSSRSAFGFVNDVEALLQEQELAAPQPLGPAPR